MKVALFGGSFNPPHLAHVLAIAAVISAYEIDRVLVIPAYQHPFAKSLASFEDRLEMCRLAMGWLPCVEISRVEQELGGESRTLRTVEYLREKHPDWEMRLVIGADILLEAKKWFGFDKICQIAPPLVLGRHGVKGTSAPEPLLPGLSSTEVRQLLAAGELAQLEGILPRRVLSYIREKGLYTG